MKETVFRGLLFCAILFFGYKIYIIFVGGDISNVSIYMEESEKYSESEIVSAMNTVERSFQRRFNGCTLSKLEYREDYETESWEEMYSAKTVIVIFSEFTTGEKGVDGSMIKNALYSEWMWILVKNDFTNRWIVADYGY